MEDAFNTPPGLLASKTRERARGMTTVGLVQINTSVSGQNYLPLSVGTLQAYAQRHLTNPAQYRFLLPVYSRGPVEAKVEALLDADVVLFSAYVWNFRISLEIARRLKAMRPDTLIVFGGPHVPDRIGDFLHQHRFIDLACHGGGAVDQLSGGRRHAGPESASPAAEGPLGGPVAVSGGCVRAADGGQPA
jgi:hypothetical protein